MKYTRNPRECSPIERYEQRQKARKMHDETQAKMVDDDSGTSFAPEGLMQLLRDRLTA